MSRTAGAVLGVVLTLAGLVFFLQGIGALQGSTMSDTTTWSILGPIIAVVGVVLIVRGLRPGKPLEDRRDR